MTEPLNLQPYVALPAVAELEQTAQDAYTSFARREPAALTGLLGGPVLGLLTLIAPGHADNLASQVTALVVTLVVAFTGFVVRRYVSPEWKHATGRTLPPFPDPATYSDAFDDSSGVWHPAAPPPSPRSLDDSADEVTGRIPMTRPSPAPGRHEADVAASSSDAYEG